MSFYRITDSNKRNSLVADYVATVKRIKERNYNERLGDLAHQSELNETLNPIIESHEKSTTAITNELKPMKKEIINLNKRLEGNYVSTPGAKRKEREEDGQTKYYGVWSSADKGRHLGNKDITIDENQNIHLDDTVYKGTPGLWKLILDNNPTDYTPEDWNNYKEIVVRTNLINNPSGVHSRSRPHLTKKYKLIKRALEEAESEADSEVKGEGIQFLPSDIKSLFDKLKLLTAEYKAGNKATRNEIVAILDQLREQQEISEKDYTRLNTLLQ